jgi:hypothetical protein
MRVVGFPFETISLPKEEQSDQFDKRITEQELSLFMSGKEF